MGKEKKNPYCLKCLFFIEPKNVSVKEIMELLEIGWCFGYTDAAHERDGLMGCFEEKGDDDFKETTNRRLDVRLKEIQNTIQVLREDEKKIKKQIEELEKRMGV